MSAPGSAGAVNEPLWQGNADEAMQAVILAAGRARRLGEVGIGSPKCLLEIGGRPLIEYSLGNLVQGGINHITIVTGHCDGAIQGVLGMDHLGTPIRYLFNPDYGNTGSVLSLLVGAEGAEASSLVVVESDILYHPQFIAVMMDSADDTIMVADASGSGDEVFVCDTADGRLAYLGKAATPLLRGRSLGEYAGMARLSGDFCRLYCEHALSLKCAGRADGHYEELIFALAEAGQDVRVKHCQALPWAEVDTLEDLDRARDVVFPRLRHLWPIGENGTRLMRPLAELPREGQVWS